MVLVQTLLSLSFFALSASSVLSQNVIDDSIMREVYLDRGFSPLEEEKCWNTVARTNRNRVIEVCHKKEPGVIEFIYTGYSRDEVLLTDIIEVDNVGSELLAASAVRNYVLSKIEGDNFNSYYPFETFAQENSDVGKVNLPNSVIYFSLEDRDKIIRIENSSQRQ